MTEMYHPENDPHIDQQIAELWRQSDPRTRLLMILLGEFKRHMSREKAHELFRELTK